MRIIPWDFILEQSAWFLYSNALKLRIERRNYSLACAEDDDDDDSTHNGMQSSLMSLFLECRDSSNRWHAATTNVNPSRTRQCINQLIYTLCVGIDKVAKSRKKSCHARLLIRDKNTSTFHRLSIKTAQLNSRAAFMIARAIRFIFAMRLNELNNRSDWRERELGKHQTLGIITWMGANWECGTVKKKVRNCAAMMMRRKMKRKIHIAEIERGWVEYEKCLVILIVLRFNYFHFKNLQQPENARWNIKERSKLTRYRKKMSRFQFSISLFPELAAIIGV